MTGQSTAKPLKKQFQKKKFADLAVQGTNNSSIASKRSVELLYLPKIGVGSNATELKPGKEYFKFFVPKKIKRSPCITRGYWLRLHAIRSRLESILDNNSNEVVVINLGCGYDPLPFEMLDSKNLQYRKYSTRLNFIDIDYSDLLSNKVQMIRASEELQEIIGEEIDVSPNQITTKHYKTRACDLYDTTQFEKLLSDNNLDNPSITKIFIAEVSLAYMKHDKANDIIKSCSKFPNSHIVVLEQIIPEGRYEPFSGRMLMHFTKNESPLQTVLSYPTIESQIKRFKELGFNNVNAGDMFQLWKSLPDSVHKMIDQVEPFDELEEFHLFCHHYMLCHSTNDKSFAFLDPYAFYQPAKLDSIPVSENNSIMEIDLTLNKKFMSGFTDDSEDIILHGGSNPYRTNETVKVNLNDCNNAVLEISGSPDGRLCHSFSSLLNNKFHVLIGGRKAPHQPLNEIWVYDTTVKAWKKGPDLENYRFRHCTLKIDEQTLIIYGGNTNISSVDAFLQLSIDEKGSIQVQKINVEGIDSLAGSSACYNPINGQVIIVGGTRDGTLVNDKLTVFDYDRDNLTLKLHKTITNDYFRRFGSKMVHLSANEYLIVGGTSPDRLFNEKSSIIKVDITTESITTIPIPKNIWESDKLMLVGFELAKLKNGRVCIIGGGATCYGFGSVSNGTYIIS